MGLESTLTRLPAGAEGARLSKQRTPSTVWQWPCANATTFVGVLPGSMAGKADQAIYEHRHQSNENWKSHSECDDAIAEADGVKQGNEHLNQQCPKTLQSPDRGTIERSPPCHFSHAPEIGLLRPACHNFGVVAPIGTLALTSTP